MPPLDPTILANELHDGVIQELSALLLQMETYERRLQKDPEAASQDLKRMKDQTRSTLNQLRQLVTRLRDGGPPSPR
ncbi:MAG TPA: histidine kinase dimerization/phosphoacceptor domain-containing protein [Anaerolineales bacterium]|jgi:signal transduction histidine kinase|nr:histidine kinase dimerization/phosphoacceptor domain-containing protein [Anaerolineales bacterium]